MTPAMPVLNVEEQPSAADLTFLQDQIDAYNMAKVNAYDGRLLAIFVRDDAGAIRAGISGYTWARFCEIEFFWVDEAYRGQGYGTQLLAAAEAEARARGCGLVVLSSYTFQAPDFYRRHGYVDAGQVVDCPPGYTCFYFQKSLR